MRASSRHGGIPGDQDPDRTRGAPEAVASDPPEALTTLSARAQGYPWDAARLSY
jgi:hypothetical protein